MVNVSEKRAGNGGKIVRIVTGGRGRCEGEKDRKCEERKGLGIRGKGQESAARSLEGEAKQAANSATKSMPPAARHAESRCFQHTMSR